MLAGAGGGNQQAARVGATICAEKDNPASSPYERSDMRDQPKDPDVASLIRATIAKAESRLYYRPGRSSRLSNPAATLTPTWPCTLKGCSAIELAEPPTSTLPPTPTPSVALPCAPT